MTSGIVALITARGGSKRLPRKNILTLAGKPMIAWTIDAARGAKAVSRVIVSTDDAEIADISRQYGAEVPFLRPAELAHDRASHVAVVEHALGWLAGSDSAPEYLLLLQPTSPLRTAEDIDGIIAFARTKRAASAVGLRETADHPFLCGRLADDGRLVPFLEQPEGYLRSQDFPPAFVINGALYLISPRAFAETRSIVSRDTFGYIMPTERSIDVDEMDDLRRAERVLLSRNADVVGAR